MSQLVYSLYLMCSEQSTSHKQNVNTVYLEFGT